MKLSDRLLPNSWIWSTLDEACQVILGQSPLSETYNSEGIGLPFYQGKAEFGDLYPTPEKWCSSPKKIAEENDILISVRAPVGPTNLCQERSCIGRGLAAIRPSNGMPTKFFLYFLRYIEKEWDSKATGTTFKAITGDVLRNQEIPLPPLAEQERIVARLEELLSDLEAGVRALERVRAGAKRYKASVLKAACEGRLFGEKPEGLPASWQWVKAKEICEFITKGTTPKAVKLFAGSGEIPFIKVYNLKFDGTLAFSVNPTFVSKQTHDGELARSKIFPGDVLMNIVGPPLGKVSIVPNIFPEWNMNQAIARFRPLPDCDGKYLVTVLLSDNTLKWATKRAKATAGQFNLTLEICRELPIPLPPLEEQRRIVAEVERRLESARAVEAAVEAGLKRARRLRQAVLKAAFEGRL